VSLGLAGLAWLGVVATARRAHDTAPLTLHFLRVGQGDATLIRTPGRHWLLVDAGPAPPAGPDLVPLLRRLGVRRLSAVILSHPHADHFGGLPGVLSSLPVGLMLDPGDQTPDSAYRHLLETVDRSGVPWRAARRGLSFSVDGVTFEILHPDTLWRAWGEDVNEDSIVLRVTWRNFEALLAGDAGFPAESALAGRVGVVDVLKAGHHGSAGSTGDAWLAELRPRATILSFGRNRYGHPAPTTVARLARHQVPTWSTRRAPVVVRTDGSMITIEGDSGIVSFPALPGPEGRQSHF
jgi:competence protein ComEC